MLDSRSLVIGGIAGFSLALIGAGFLGCQKGRDDKSKAENQTTTAQMPAAAPQTPEELNVPLAKVDDVVITVGEFQDRINRQSPYVRARYTSLEQKKEFLDTLIRFEILAKEAVRRGFDKDPEVVRTMKQVMIQKLMKDEFESKITPDQIKEEEMKAFYDQHQEEYNKPEEVRVSAVIVDSKAVAEKVAKEATSEKGQSNKGFRDLVDAHSKDADTKARGGDLRYFSRDTTEIPKPVVEAAFNLEKSGDVAGPIDAGGGKFYVIKQTGRRKAMSKSFDDVKRQIQNRIYRDKRTQSQRDFIEGLKAKAQVTINEANLDKVRIDTSTRSMVDAPTSPGALPAFPEQAEE